MTNQISRKFKLNSEIKAVVSLVLGVFGVILLLSPVLFLFLGMNPMSPSPILNIVFFLPVTSLTGLILGIMGLKSTKRNFATAGIVLNTIGLSVPVYYFLFH